MKQRHATGTASRRDRAVPEDIQRGLAKIKPVVSEQDQRSDQSNKNHLLIVLMLLGVGLCLRLSQFNLSGLWLDECITAYRVLSLHAVFNQNDMSPWFYPLVVFPFSQLLGPSEFALRLPSLLAGVAFGPAIFLVLRRRWSSEVAVLGGGLGTLNALSIFYSGEARVYSLAMLLSIIWTGLLQELLYPQPGIQPSRATKTAFVVLSPMVALCHHYCLYIGAAGFVVAVYRMSTDRVLRSMLWPTFTAAYTLTLVLWLPLLLGDTVSNMELQRSSRDNPYSPHARPDDIISESLGTPLNPLFPAYALGWGALIAGASTVALTLGKRAERAGWGWGAQYFLCLVFTIIGHALVPSYLAGRYDTVYLGLPLVCVSLAVFEIPSVAFRRIVVASLILFQSYNALLHVRQTVNYSSTREIAAYIAKEKPDLVIATLPGDFDPLYLMPVAYYMNHRLGLDVPIIEVPRFVPVPNGFVTPSLYYALYTEIRAIPTEQTCQEIEETISKHKKVVIIGQREQIQKYAPAINKFQILNDVVLLSFRERATFLLTLSPPPKKAGD